MVRPLKEIEQELTNLSHEERARLAHALIVSLDEEEGRLSKAERDALWLEEIKRRDAEIERGEVQLIPAEAAMRRAHHALEKDKK